MQSATGGFYKVGNPATLWKIGGRAFSADTSAHSTTEVAKVKGLYLAQFDSGGTDLLLALANQTLYKKTPVVDANPFAALVSSLSAASTNLSGVHYNNRHYLCTGSDLNIVLESDATTRTMGLQVPQIPVTAAVSTLARTNTRFTTAQAVTDYAAASDWQQTAKAIDSDNETFSWVTIGTNDLFASAKEQVWDNLAAASDTASGRRLEVIYRVATGHVQKNPGDDIGSGGGSRGRFRVRAIITYSTDGVTFNKTLINAVYTKSMSDKVVLHVPVAVNSNLLMVKASLTMLKKGDPVHLQIADVRVARGGAEANFTTTTGFYYAYTEFDAATETESSPSPTSAIVTVTAQNLVTLTFPATAENSRATHRRLYRTPDGGVAPSQLGRIAEIPIAETTFYDGFDTPFDLQASHIVPLLPLQAAGGQEYVPLNDPPPTCKVLFVHRGRMLGIPASSDRAFAYSEPGLPESWPSVNSDSDFALKEGDRLVTAVSLGDMIVAFCSTTVVTLIDVPSWSDGTFRSTPKTTLPNAPGCVGQDAVCTFTAGGSMLAAWVSPFGIYVTDGHSARRVSDDQDWTATVSQTFLSTSVLHWDRNRQCIVFAYDSTASGLNDRFALIHMASEHQKENGQPLWTGPHYGPLACMASGIVAGTPRLWSGQTSNGIVFIENSGTLDRSQFYSSLQVPFIILTGRIYGDTLGAAIGWRDWSTYKARLRHTAAGGAEVMSIQWTTGRDSSGATQVVTKTPSIVLDRSDEFYVGLGGEWAEIQLTHTIGAASFGVLDLTLDVTAMGRSGKVA